jgi:plastocyanin
VKFISLSLAALAALGVIAVAAQGASTSKTLRAKTGPGFTISLKNAAGQKVKKLRHGTYTIKVSDKSAIHNFHLKGPGGVNKKTSVPFVGSKTWHVKFVKGTYKYVCDIHKTIMHGSFKVT